MRLPAFAGFAAVVFCGVGFAVVSGAYLDPLWASLGWRQPVAEQIINIGFGDTAVYYWGLVWVYIPRWVLAATLGSVCGICLPARWLVASLLGSIVFISTPFVFVILMGQQSLLTAFSWERWFFIESWEVFSIVLVALVAAMFFRRKAKQPGDSVPSGQEKGVGGAAASVDVLGGQSRSHN